MREFFIIIAMLFLGLQTVQAHPAWGIAVDDEKNIYFADVFHNNGTVWKLTAGGILIPVLKNFHAHNVNIDGRGNIFSAHGEGIHRLVKISADGKSHETLVSSDDETSFSGGNAAVSESGSIFFGIRKYIWRYRQNNSPVKFVDHRLEWNQAMFVDDDGSIYAPDIGVGNGTIFKFQTNGKAIKIADDLISKLDRPKDRHNDVLLGMAKDKSGNFYVAETAGRRIVKIDPAGKSSTFYSASPGWKPTAITFSDGIAYIHEYGRIGKGYDFRIISLDPKMRESELVKHSTYLADKSSTGLLKSWICTPSQACLGFQMFLREWGRISFW